MELSAITLASFNAVANLGSVAAGSKELNVAGSVVSRNIKRLEDVLQVCLFDRSVRGMKLTPAGEYLVAYTRRARLEQDVALTQLRNWSQEIEGHIRFSVSEGLSTTFAPELVSEYCKQYPRVSFDVSCDTQSRTFQALEQGETDIALVFDGEISTQAEVLGHEKFYSRALIAPRHPLSSKTFLTIQELSQYPFTTSANSTTRQLLDRVAAMNGRRLTVAMTCTSSVAMYNMCSNSDAINISCYLSYYRFVELGLIVARDFENSVQMERGILIATMRGRSMPKHLKNFVDFVSAKLSEFSRQAAGNV